MEKQVNIAVEKDSNGFFVARMNTLCLVVARKTVLSMSRCYRIKEAFELRLEVQEDDDIEQLEFVGVLRVANRERRSF